MRTPLLAPGFGKYNALTRSMLNGLVFVHLFSISTITHNAAMGHAVVNKNCINFSIMMFFLTGVLVDKNLAHFAPFECIAPVDSQCETLVLLLLRVALEALASVRDMEAGVHCRLAARSMKVATILPFFPGYTQLAPN
jgi:hypothetical protein